MPPQLAELYTQYREKHNQEEETVAESLAQYQRTGECRMAHIIDAAQLTHPISRAEDIDLPSNLVTPRPDTDDIATPRRRIGGRCRKWAVSTQATSKRKCAACTT